MEELVSETLFKVNSLSIRTSKPSARIQKRVHNLTCIGKFFLMLTRHKLYKVIYLILIQWGLTLLKYHNSGSQTNGFKLPAISPIRKEKVSIVYWKNTIKINYINLLNLIYDILNKYNNICLNFKNCYTVFQATADCKGIKFSMFSSYKYSNSLFN